uniref:centrosomal protein 20-like n=1 Tax=Myxine glutinosa TaxID=7769 RepID=UPI00358E0A84
MATVDELKNVLKETLEQRGLLGQVRAQVRAAVFSALDEQNAPRPSLPNSNLLINELIREYLEHNQYKYTASVLLAEAGQPETPLGREFMTQELNIRTDEKMEGMPLLYGMLSHFLQHGERSQEEIPARLHPDRQCSSSSGLSHKVPH